MQLVLRACKAKQKIHGMAHEGPIPYTLGPSPALPRRFTVRPALSADPLRLSPTTWRRFVSQELRDVERKRNRRLDRQQNGRVCQ
ncbi:hypothetical protein VTN02DRAFT_572 [Thermoascus thermophilus]